MDRIRYLAAVSVLRGSGFACLAIVTAMSGVMFDPELAFLLGATLMLTLAIVLELKARTFHRVRRISETEVWVLLGDGNRPPKDEARRLIIAAMTRELHEKALWAALIAAALWAISVLAGLLD